MIDKPGAGRLKERSLKDVITAYSKGEPIQIQIYRKKPEIRSDINNVKTVKENPGLIPPPKTFIQRLKKAVGL